MKKFALILFALGINVMAGAQRQNIQSASNYFNDKEYDKALTYIEKAVKDPSTEKDPKAWMVRGNIYVMLQKDPVKAPTSPYREAAVSYLKVVELKADYEKDAISTGLLNCLYLYYNDAVKAYNDSKFEDAMKYMRKVTELASVENGKRFAAIKQIDTINAEAKFINAKSARFLQKNDDALPLFLELKSNPIVKRPEIYAMIIDIYRDKNMDKELLATIEEAKKTIP